MSSSRLDQSSADAHLLRDLFEQRPGAWRRFLDRFDVLIRRTIRATTRRGRLHLTPADRADIRASFFAGLVANRYGKLRAFDPLRGHPLEAWLVVLVQHEAIDFVRAARMRMRLRITFALASQEVGPPCVEDAVDDRRCWARLVSAAATLTARQRELFDLCFERGLDAEQVARVMGTSVQTVHSGRHKIELHLASVIRAGEVRAAA